ncbi:TPA: DUF1799 domain-containing protein [Pseudomonas aeruginosa]|uniref:DUF1799 domain-containing protein n=1 Tax=Pseudomonas aeruginosa TaxID=287 RepID=UPI0028AB0651|nr:DUF1799 domain-containing protein [Pseudomonas aeruginosa]
MTSAAAALYKTEPDAEALAALGLRPDDLPVEEVAIWPENWRAFLLFRDMSTQWRTGMNGPTGLDYGVLQDILRLRGVPRAQWSELFDAVQAMEAVALTTIHEG